jgi:bacteriocin biosynthesis cyclodehydratase domain-containing protein
MSSTDSSVQTRQVLVLTAGAFGNAVGARLAGHLPVTMHELIDGTHSSLWPYTELIVLATSHERPRLAEGIDQAAFRLGVPWFAVRPGATDLQCGPVVVPGRTACYQCYLARRNQHRQGAGPEPDADRTQPTGFPQHHVGIAAGFALQAIDEVFAAPDPKRLGGTIRRFDQVIGTISRSSVVAVDRCPRCRRLTGPRSEELFGQLAAMSATNTEEAKAV